MGESIVCLSLLKKIKLLNLPLVSVPAAAGQIDNADVAIINSLPFSGFLKKAIVENCECMNFISPGIKKSILEFGMNVKVQSEIPNGVEVIDGVNISRVANEKIKLIFVGRLVYQKGLDVLLAALHKIKIDNSNFILQIVGDGPELASLKKMVVDFSLENQIEFLGKMPHQSVSHLLMHSHFFILPSRYEGLSNAALEALSVGLPCVLTRCDGVDGLVSNDAIFLSDTNSCESLYDAIFSAFSLTIEEWGEMSKKAKSAATEKFSIKSIAGRNITLFDSLIKGA